MGRIQRMTSDRLGVRTAPAAVFAGPVCQDHAKPSWAILRPIFSATHCGRKLLWVCDLALAVPVSDSVLECQETTKCRKATNCRPGTTRKTGDQREDTQAQFSAAGSSVLSIGERIGMPILKRFWGWVSMCLCVQRQAAQLALSRLTARPKNP